MFAFDIGTTLLIAAWSPFIQLYQPDSVKDPNIFINAATYDYPTFELPDGCVVDKVSHSFSRRSLRYFRDAHDCLIMKESSVIAFLAPSFLKLFDDDETKTLQVIKALFNQVSKLFLSTTCVRVCLSRVFTPKQNYVNNQEQNPPTCVRVCLSPVFTPKHSYINNHEQNVLLQQYNNQQCRRFL